MIQTIWKYEIKVRDKQVIEMPILAELLSVQTQRNSVCIWALVKPKNPLVHRRIQIVGTGHDLTRRIMGKFLGSIQFPDDGDLVFHVFDGGEG